MKIFIKYMVSIRCKIILRNELEKLGLDLMHVQLGEAEILGDITAEQREDIKVALAFYGLELMDDKRAILMEKIKNVIVELIHYSDKLPKVKFSNYLSEKLKYDYTYLSNMFSETEGITIEHYILIHKIERVKELLIYGESNLTEIAYQLRYSSVSHLSNQFKKITGLTPSYFKSLKGKRRNYLETL